MQHKIILGLLFILVVVGGGVFLLNFKKVASSTNKQETVSAQNTHNENAATEETGAVTETIAYIITYTPDGFSPETVEVPIGATVEFKNESNAFMWVASAIHPTHSLYPQKSSGDCLGSSFDACAATEHGSSWSFTFTEAGSWNYHNHVRANHRGTITVK